jgi:hypothetical protein
VARRLSVLYLLAGLALLGTTLLLQPARAAARPAAEAVAQAAAQVPTRVVVLVIANGGKFVGDDIGGALVTVRDLRTQEVLASGRTHGGSGLPDLPTIEVTRLQEIPEEEASRFETTLLLDTPRLVEVTAYGPLAAQAAAAQATTTAWLLPATNAADANRVVLSLRGLIVQVLSPPTHFLPTVHAPLPIALRANVTMMCGCPIGATYPWHPQDYQVQATILDPAGNQQLVPLAFDTAAPAGAPSQFVGTWTAPAAGIYEVVVTAHQPIHDNNGSDRVAFIVP